MELYALSMPTPEYSIQIRSKQTDNTLHGISLKENFFILIQISLNFVSIYKSQGLHSLKWLPTPVRQTSDGLMTG